MIKVPTIKGSAQAKLLLYQLLSSALSDTEERLLSAEPSSWERIIAMLEDTITSYTQTKSHEAVFKKAFSHIEQTTREGLQKQIERLSGKSLWLGKHPSGLLDSFIQEHQKLLKSVKQEHLDKIGLAINRGLRDGRLPKDITDDILKATGMSKRRARLIARNAPLQYSGALTKHNQMSAGIKSYIWQSSRDARVRDFHRKLDGEILSWDGPGPHPRSEVNCRCDAIPILDL